MTWQNLFNKRYVPFLAILGVTILVWGHTANFDFVWDDAFFIINNSAVTSLEHVPAMFTRLEAQSSYPEAFVLFRPLRTLHYALLYGFSGERAPDPFLFHTANIIWHAAASMMLFLVCRFLVQRHTESKINSTWVPLVVGLAFALHPVASEVVCWAKSLDDIMATFFVLLTLYWIGQSATQNPLKFYSLAIMAFAAAVYSKESAVPGAALVFLFYTWVLQTPLYKSFVKSLPFLGVGFLFMVHRHLVIGRSDQTEPISGTYSQTLLDMVPVVLKYTRLLLGIPPFNIDYSFLQGGYSISSPAVIGGFALMVVVLAAVFLLSLRTYTKPAAFSLAWIVLMLLPVANILPMMQYMADRFLYLPLIGFLLFMGFFLGYARPRIILLISILVLGTWGMIAWQRSWIWKDETTLFGRTNLEGPWNPRVRHNAVVASFHLPHMQKVFGIDDRTGQLLRVYPIDPQKTDPMVKTLEELKKEFPEHENPYTALGILYSLRGQHDTAIEHLKKSIERSKNKAGAHANLAKAYLDAGRLDEAGKAIEQSLQLEPRLLRALRLAEIIYQKSGQPQKRRAILETLLKMNPDEEEYKEKLKSMDSPSGND